MENPDFKRPGKPLKTFEPFIKSKLFTSDKSFGRNLKTFENVVIKSYPLQPLVYDFSQLPLEAQRKDYEESILRIYSRVEDGQGVKVEGRFDKNEEYEAALQRIKKVVEEKRGILEEMKEENERISREVEENRKVAEGVKMKIRELEGKKRYVEGILKAEKKIWKLFKDLTRFEIVETYEENSGVRIRVNNDLVFVEFKLYKEGENTYGYMPLSTNMDYTAIPDILKSEISFEESQMKAFYFYVMDFIES